MTITTIRDFYPDRRGADIFVTVDGKETKLSPMQANLILQAWAKEVGAALVVAAHSSGSSPVAARCMPSDTMRIAVAASSSDQPASTAS